VRSSSERTLVFVPGMARERNAVNTQTMSTSSIISQLLERKLKNLMIVEKLSIQSHCLGNTLEHSQEKRPSAVTSMIHPPAYLLPSQDMSTYKLEGDSAITVTTGKGWPLVFTKKFNVYRKV
jgi:hypothetical protein